MITIRTAGRVFHKRSEPKARKKEKSINDEAAENVKRDSLFRSERS